MKYCELCLQVNTRPGTVFINGICPACQFKNNSSIFDWHSRLTELQNVIEKSKSEYSKSGYDSLLGVSGGKDSTRLALWARDFLGLNPLLVCVSYPPNQVTKVGVRNLNNLVELS